MDFTDEEIDMLISGCVHYRNVYGDLANQSAVARDRKQRFIDLRAKLQAYKDERSAYFNDEINININKKNIMRIACEIYGARINDPKDHLGTMTTAISKRKDYYHEEELNRYLH